MRKIKVRAWDEKRKKMIYDFSEFCDEDSLCLYILGNDDKDYLECSAEGDGRVLPLMMSLEKEDKKGTTLYEQDIIKIHSKSLSISPYFYLIEFINGGFCATNKVTNQIIPLSEVYKKYEFEIVGNIFQNKILLCISKMKG